MCCAMARRWKWGKMEVGQAQPVRMQGIFCCTPEGLESGGRADGRFFLRMRIKQFDFSFGLCIMMSQSKTLGHSAVGSASG